MADTIGIVTLFIDGSPIETMPGASIQLGGYVSEPVVTDQGTVHGKEKYKEGMITCSIPITADTPVEDLRNFKNGDITYEARGVGTWTMGFARVQAEELTLSNEPVEFKFFGAAAKAA